MSQQAAGNSEHRVELEPARARVRVLHGGETIAETDRPLIVHETGYPPAYYVPREDVREEFLKPTDHSTHCPYKGNAAYWTVEAGGKTAENAVWIYPKPLDDVAGLHDHMGFYTDRLDGFEVSDEP